jgi:hypothetical protein
MEMERAFYLLGRSDSYYGLNRWSTFQTSGIKHAYLDGYLDELESFS